MIVDRHSFLIASLTALLLTASSCSTPDSTEAVAPSVDADTGTMVETALALGPQDPQSIARQRNRALVEKRLEEAEALIQRGQPEAARIALIQARTLDPTNAEVQRLLEVVAAQIQDPTTTAESFGEMQARLYQINQERRRSEVQSHLDLASTALQENNYDRAISELRRAKLNIQIGTNIEWGDLGARVDSMLARAESERDQADAQRRDAVQQDLLRRQQQLEAEAAARRTARVGELLVQAGQAFQARQFELARDLAFDALQQDSTNEVARDIHNASIKAARETRTERYYREMSREIRKMLEAAEDLRVPQTDIIYVNQAAWERAKRRVAPISATSGMTAEDAALRAKLESETIAAVSFTEDDGTYDEVKTRIQTITNIPIIITPEARETIDGEGLVMVMDVTAPIKVSDFLDLMVQKSESLAWTVEHGVVQLTTKARAGGSNRMKLIDVRDLIFPRTVFLPPQIRDIPSGEEDEGAPRTGGEGEEKTYFVELDSLISNIKDATGIDYWESGEEGVAIDQSDSGYLLVSANPEMLARVESVLNDMRRFASTVVTIESKFLQITQDYLQEIGVDFRGLGGSGAKGDVATLDDVTSGLDDNASRGFDNGGTGDPAGNPVSGAFFNDGGDGDVRARTENYFVNDALGNVLSPTGGATAAIVFLDDLQLQAIIRAVEKQEDIQELQSQTLTILNNQRGHVAVINQTAYIRDFDVEVAQAAFIADPKIDVIQDGMVLDVKPTILYDRKHITLDMQPTVAELVRPIPTFSTSLAGTTQPVTLQLPQLSVRSFATTATVPDGGSVLIGGLREVQTTERRAEVPILGDIPLLSFFFKTEGVADEKNSLMVLVRATVTNVERETY